ncbi:GPI-anchored wall transfer protein [Striga asiatica]|uniref:GPI-anchored wall transfer protein n=1 Tax=Striga asiatica TaxID=4170 RepID=A0A5A7QIW3_STRAF|nr:GPI-anchored wall transfer protein [Striga asiatica]
MESFNPNKHLKEQFVSNLIGSSKLEIFFLITNFSILILIRHCIGFSWTNYGSSKKDDNASNSCKNLKAYIATLSLDFLCIAIPYALFMTYRNGSSLLQENGINSIRATISSYRVSMMLGTSLCILAVDFKIFPRRYAKTETYGSSLVHVGEYGVHWNFFFTLAAVAILTSVINVDSKYSGVLGSFILFAYQALLSCGLNEYLLSEERGTDIFSQNKEGIFSIFGYWGMYLLGVGIGRWLFFGDNLKTKKWATTRVWALCFFFWALTLFLELHIEKVSRRMCNVAYVSLTLACNLQMICFRNGI